MAGKVPHHRRLTAISDLVSSIEMMMMMAGHQESLVRPLFLLFNWTYARRRWMRWNYERVSSSSFIHSYILKTLRCCSMTEWSKIVPLPYIANRNRFWSASCGLSSVFIISSLLHSSKGNRNGALFAITLCEGESGR